MQKIDKGVVDSINNAAIALTPYLDSEDDVIAGAAQVLKTCVANGMTSSEIKEITEDIFDLKMILAEIEDVERKILIEDAFNAMILIVTSIPI